MAKNFRPTGQERFNFIASLAAYLIHNEQVSIEQVAAHFEVDTDYIRDAISTLVVTETVKAGYADTHFTVDFDQLDDDGIISFWANDAFEDAPKLSGRQASAIAAGLTYLSSFPHFANQEEIAQLLDLLGKGTNADTPRIFEYKPGSIDANAAIIRRAILSGHRIRCNYKNLRGEGGTREIDPLRLDPRGDIWYLRGYCLKNKELRNFRLDHMQGAEELQVEISEEARSISNIVDEEYTANQTDVEVVIEVDPEALSMIHDFAGTDIHTTAEGRTQATIKVGYLPNLGRVICHYGGAARVISPESARSAVRNYALKALGKQTEDQLGED